MSQHIAFTVAFVFVVVCSAQSSLPDGILPRPNTTSELAYLTCNDGKLGVDPECGYDAPFCTTIGYSANAQTPNACRPGLVDTRTLRTASYDDINICNCPVGFYTRKLIDQAEEAGTCVPFTKVGRPCTVDENCIEARGRLITSPSVGDDNNPDGQLHCSGGFCRMCNVPKWASSHRLPFDDAQVGRVSVCPGIDGPASEKAGYVVLLTSRPGETRKCEPNGTITGGGAIDYSLVSIPFTGQVSAGATAATTADTAAISAASSNGAPLLYVLALVLLGRLVER